MVKNNIGIIIIKIINGSQINEWWRDETNIRLIWKSRSIITWRSIECRYRSCAVIGSSLLWLLEEQFDIKSEGERATRVVFVDFLVDETRGKGDCGGLCWARGWIPQSKLPFRSKTY